MTTYYALFGFVAIMVGTPGPANLLVMLAGVQRGIWGSIGFICGLIFGKFLLNMFIGLGFGFVLSSNPLLHTVFGYISAGYMIWLASRSWPRASIKDSKENYNRYSQFSFRDGFVVHPLNPKAWVMVMLAWSHFAPAFGDFFLQLFVVISTFGLCQIFFHFLWCGFGAYLGKSFSGSKKLTKAMIIITVLVVVLAIAYTPQS